MITVLEKSWNFVRLIAWEPCFITRSTVNVCAISNGFFMVSLVTTRVSLEEICLPRFEVLNCWLNLVASCLDDGNEIPLKVIASFSASRFALPSIPLVVLHSLVRSVFWSMVSTKSFHFSPLCFIQSWQFRRGGVFFTEVISSVHHVQYLCWYRFLMESVTSRRDVV